MLSASQYTALKAITNCPGPTGSAGPVGPEGGPGPTGPAGPGSDVSASFTVRALTSLPLFEYSRSGTDSWSSTGIVLNVGTFTVLNAADIEIRGLTFNGTVWICSVFVKTNVDLSYPQFLYSSNGKVWTASLSQPFGTTANSVGRGAYKISWNGYIFVATGTSSATTATSIAYSTDNGVTWTAIANSRTNIIEFGRGIAWNGKVWLLTGTPRAGGTTASIAYSLNGTTWTPVADTTTFTGYVGHSVASDGIKWVVGGTNILPYYTTDSIGSSGWTVSTWPDADLTGLKVTNIGWNGRQWLLTANTGVAAAPTVATSNTATAWETRLVNSQASLIQSLTWNSSAWIITGTSATPSQRLSSSVDNGESWLSIPVTGATSIASRTIVPPLNPNGDYGNILLSGASSQLGFTTGAGGMVTQETSRSTDVTLNRPTGTIRLYSDISNSGSATTFTFNNSTIASTDMVLVQHISGGTFGIYNITATPATNNATIRIRNISASNSPTEAPVLRFVVIKSVDA